MKALLLVLFLVPSFAFAQSEPYNIYRDALGIEGVKIVGTASPEIYKETWEVFDKFNIGKQFNLTLTYSDSNSFTNNYCWTPSVGCYDWHNGIEVINSNYWTDKPFKWILFHELGHHFLQTHDETQADNFANCYITLTLNDL